MNDVSDFAGQMATQTMLSYTQSFVEAADWIALGKTLGWSLDETKAYAMRAIAGGISARAVAQVFADNDLASIGVGLVPGHPTGSTS